MPGSRLRTLAVAVLVALALLVATRQLGCGGAHAPHGMYRAQVDAFLDGRLALSPHPEGLVHDLAWTETGVQQVWGLGVPAWQTPFELLGRAVGVTPFPDRVALVAWLALMVFALLRGFGRRAGEHEPWWVLVGTLALTALLPALVSLVRGKLGVYEEAALYAYGAAMMLLGGLAGFVRRPTAAGFLVLAALAGLGGFLRPTVWFYGAATVAVAAVVWMRPHGPARRALPVLALGAALFVAGGGLLYASNAHRFGRGGEFGHRLNLHSLPGNLVATRFSYPFARAGVAAQAAELFGSLFDRPETRSKRGFYQQGLHRGQQPIARWREYYFSTFSWPYLPLLVAGVVLAALAWRRRGAPDPVARWLGPWALLGMVPLLVFYLGSPSVSSRYQLDLAPAFAALLVIAWRGFALRARGGLAVGALVLAWVAAVATSKVTRPKVGGGPVAHDAASDAAYRISRPLVGLHALPGGYDADALAFGTHSDIATAFDHCAGELGEPVACSAPPRPGDVRVHGARDAGGWFVEYARLVDEDPLACVVAPEPERPVCDAAPTIATAPDAIVEAVETAPLPLYLDNFGWDLETRRVAPGTYVFVDEPRFVELEVSASDREVDWRSEVRVAIGLDHLVLINIVETARGVQLRYESKHPLRHGLQIAYLAFGPDTALDQPRSAIELHAIRWR